MIIKPIAEEVSVTTAVDLSGARLIYIYAAASSKITIKDSDEVVKGSFTVPAGSVTIVEKTPTDTIEGTTALLCTPVSYKS